MGSARILLIAICAATLSAVVPVRTRAEPVDECREMLAPASGLRAWMDETHFSQAEIQAPLSAYEMNAIEFYTDFDFLRLNRALAEWNRSGVMPELGVHGDISAILHGLRKLPRHPGEVYRFATLKPEVLESLIPNEVYRPPVFWSSSKLSELDRFRNGANVRFKIRGKSGRDVSSLAKHPEEEEVLFAPMTAFMVKERTVVDGMLTVVIEEL